MKRLIRYSIFNLLIAALTGCGFLQGNHMNQQWFDPEIFSTVKINSEEKSACTPPDVDTPFYTGITINTPKRIGFDNAIAFVIPVCVNGTVPEMGARTPRPVLVAIDLATQKKYSGVAYEHKPPKIQGMDIDFVPPPAAPAVTPEMLQGLRGGLIFSSDLVDVVKLPKKAGKYQIYLERGDLKSNVVALEVVAGSL
jgi:hypothetical protein